MRECIECHGRENYYARGLCKKCYGRKWASTPERRRKAIARMNQWRKDNPERQKAIARRRKVSPEYRHKIYLKRKEKSAAYSKWYNRENPHVCRNACHKRRVRLKAKIDDNMSEVIATLHKKTFCYWCQCILTPKNRTIDHVTPLCRGGSHTTDNVVAACRSCNRAKGTKLYWEWDGELAA